MSKRYPGGVITKSPATPTGPYQTGAAPGIWTLDQQLQYQQQGIWPTAGLSPPYIEDVFSTYLYTGTGAAQTITNGIDLATKGGMVWMKNRTTAYDNAIVDSARGLANGNLLITNLTNAAQVGYPNNTAGISSFNTDGFTLRSDVNGIGTNYAPGDNLASWTFRKQPKFFDVVTYTGTGSNTTIAHSLGSVPGSIIVKRTDTTAAWAVYHRSLANTQYLVLNTTAAAATGATWWNSTTPTSAVFSVGTDATVNASGGTYVAYLFAHDAGGFGLTGTDNVISCGSYTGAAIPNPITLGYEPQFMLIKRIDVGGYDWVMLDTMRGFDQSSIQFLAANLPDAEQKLTNYGFPTATGFAFRGTNGEVNSTTGTYIYIAIRRGPMKVPTDATKVFAPVVRTGNGSTQTVSGLSFSPDLWMTKNRGNTQNNWFFDKLRGPNPPLSSNLTDDEATNTSNYFGGTPIFTPTNTGFTTISQGQVNTASGSYANWLFGRAPGFFDEVCYTGTGTDDRQVTHNLGVAPELIICKSRSAAWPWWVGGSVLGSTRNGMYLNDTSAKQTNADAFSTNGAAFTSSYFLVSSVSAYPPNANTYTQVAYLFATCPGVSKVGSYTGNGSTQTINCGFTGGARFVLIKRTDSTGDWYVYDTARGMTTLTDPYLLLNSTAAETATLGSVTTVSTGFALNSSILAAINVNAGTYIFLAIA